VRGESGALADRGDLLARLPPWWAFAAGRRKRPAFLLSSLWRRRNLNFVQLRFMPRGRSSPYRNKEPRMNRFTSAKTLAAAAVAFGGLALASAAQARSDVYFSIGVPGPAYVQSAPVYVQPRPVYVEPQPVYVQPAPVYVGPGYYESRRWEHRHNGWRDDDRDGVPNRYDRAPHNPYRR
jgi:hypothetical protein